jgi:hypothetical protein
LYGLCLGVLVTPIMHHTTVDDVAITAPPMYALLVCYGIVHVLTITWQSGTQVYERLCFQRSFCARLIHLIVDPQPEIAAHYESSAYEDITARVRDAAKSECLTKPRFVSCQLNAQPTGLAHGQTILHPPFSMEDAMHAWEVMNVKMDSGVGYENVRTHSELIGTHFYC